MDSVTYFSWLAPEYKHYHKNFAWYLTVLLVGVLLVLFLLYTKDVFGAVCIGIIIGFVIFFGSQKPQTVEISLGETGLAIGNTFIPYKQMNGFWMVQSPEGSWSLNVETLGLLNRLITVEMEHQNPEDVRAFLTQYVSEHTATKPTFAQKITHWVRF